MRRPIHTAAVICASLLQLACASCTRLSETQEPDADVLADGSARIRVEALTEGGSKGAPVTVMPGFTMFGYILDRYGDFDKANYLYDERFTPRGGSYASEHYHLGVQQGSTVYLWAVSPARPQGVTLPSQSAIGTPVFHYETPLAAEQQSDILVGSRWSDGLDIRTALGMNFEHILSGIRFTLSSEAPFRGVIKTVTLTDVVTEGDYYPGAGWRETGTPKDITIAVNRAIDLPLAGTDITAASQTLMLIPQRLGSHSMLRVLISSNGTERTYEYSLAGESLRQGSLKTISVKPEFPVLCFTSLQNGSTVGVANNLPTPVEMLISRDGKTWSVWNYSTVTLTEGEKMYLRGTGTTLTGGGGSAQPGAAQRFIFDIKGKVAASGDCTALTCGVITPYCYYGLFNACTGLVSAPELPATKLADGCYFNLFRDCTQLSDGPDVLPADVTCKLTYAQMFQGCSSLLKAPKIMAKELGYQCCQQMFRSCTSLVSVPDFVATKVVYRSCYTMFRDCTSLTVPPALPAVTLGDECYFGMFMGCTSLRMTPFLPAGVATAGSYDVMFSDCTSLTTFTGMNAVEMAEKSCYGMFGNCKALTVIPEVLPATTLASNCYQSMFQNCTSLTYAPSLPATTVAKDCYHSMFQSCSSLNHAQVRLPAMTLEDSCYQAMFSHCENLVKAPELPATTLADNCYNSMFADCRSLAMVPDLPATELKFACYKHMFAGCTGIGNTVVLPASTLVENCYGNMFGDGDMCNGSSINHIICKAADISASGALTDFLKNNTATYGVFEKPAGVSYPAGVIPAGWVVKDL